MTPLSLVLTVQRSHLSQRGGQGEPGQEAWKVLRGAPQTKACRSCVRKPGQPCPNAFRLIFLSSAESLGGAILISVLMKNTSHGSPKASSVLTVLPRWGGRRRGGEARVEPRRGRKSGEARGPQEVRAGGRCPPLAPPPREGEGWFPLRRRLRSAGSSAFVFGTPPTPQPPSPGNPPGPPGPAPEPRPARRHRLRRPPLRSAPLGSGSARARARGAGLAPGGAAAAPDMSGPRAGFYRQELNKTVWEVPQRLQGLRPVGSGAYGSVW